MINEFLEIGIQPKGNRVQQKVTCPNCVKVGKTNIKDTCLSIDLFNGLYNCHKCGWKGCVAASQRIKYELPTKKNFTKISLEALQFFTNRGITQKVVISNKVVQEGEWVVFPYLRNGNLINFKKRSTKTKDFRQAVNAEAIIYNYDRVKNAKEIIITEGEFDCMAFEVAGFENVTSVNQGAPNENDKNVDKKLECITNCYEVFEQAEIVYLAVDNDVNGKRLEKELIRRIGSEKIRLISFPDGFKDANEVLLGKGTEALIECVKKAKELKIEGTFDFEDVRESMVKTFLTGKSKGTTTHWPYFDTNFTHRTGEVNLWTGYMNEGKSTFVKQTLLAKVIHDDWKIAVFSPEEYPPDDFFDDLISMYIGKSTDRSNREAMTLHEYEAAINRLKGNVFFIYPDKDFSFESIEEACVKLIKRHGIRSVMLDPYNQFDHDQGNQREDLYISKFMAKLKRFALTYDISIHLIAHQITPIYIPGQDYPKPNAYRIKGGGTFADKADNVICVWRPFRNTDYKNPEVLVIVNKIKKQKLTGIPGEVKFDYDFTKNRYYLYGKSPFDGIKVEQAKMALPENNNFLQSDPGIIENKEMTDLPF